jgi:hypothetical protein
MLLERGADVDAVDGDGDTPLLLAAGSQHLDMVRLLLGAVPPPRLQAVGSGRAPVLVLACAAEQDDLVTVLLEARADAGAVGRATGRSALHYAASAGMEETVSRLLEAGAPPTAVCRLGWTVLMHGLTPFSGGEASDFEWDEEDDGDDEEDDEDEHEEEWEVDPEGEQRREFWDTYGDDDDDDEHRELDVRRAQCIVQILDRVLQHGE